MQCSRIDSSILPLWWRQPITLHHQNPQLCAITFAREADWLNRHPSILLEELQGDWCWLLLSDHVVPEIQRISLPGTSSLIVVANVPRWTVSGATAWSKDGRGNGATTDAFRLEAGCCPIRLLSRRFDALPPSYIPRLLVTGVVLNTIGTL